jgi:hypothetical protein
MDIHVITYITLVFWTELKLVMPIYNNYYKVIMYLLR